VIEWLSGSPPPSGTRARTHLAFVAEDARLREAPRLSSAKPREGGVPSWD